MTGETPSRSTPGATGGWTATITVHGIGRPERQLDDGENEVWISVGEFEELLDVVADQPHVSLTFDDGNASDLEIGLPRLLERGLRAGFFIPAGLMGQPGRLDAAGVQALHAAGMLVGSHGWAHRDWRSLDWRSLDWRSLDGHARRGSHADPEAEQELVRARDALAELVGTDSAQVAVPFGSYDRHVLTALRRSGATRVYTSDGGWARTGAWLHPRTSIRAGDGGAWAHRLASTRPGLGPRARSHLARSVKRWRG